MNKLKIVNAICVIICTVLFFLLMADVWAKYTSRFTSIGVRFEPQNKLKKTLPCATACPSKGFRTRGFFYKEEDFLRNTFNRDDIFYDAPSFGIFNRSAFLIEEVKSSYLGRCYMVCALEEKFEAESAIIPLRRMTDLTGTQALYTNKRNADTADTADSTSG